jgi:hypothetical protein
VFKTNQVQLFSKIWAGAQTEALHSGPKISLHGPGDVPEVENEGDFSCSLVVVVCAGSGEAKKGGSGQTACETVLSSLGPYLS